MVSIGHDRRDFARVRAPLVHRPVTRFAIGMPRRAADLTIGGGFRAYSDERLKKGRLLEVEVFLPGGSVTLVAEVAWVDELPEGSPARFDIGMRYVKASAEDLKQLSAVLGP